MEILKKIKIPGNIETLVIVICIFLIRLPNFYIIPIHSSVFLSHNWTRLFIIFGFLLTITRLVQGKNEKELHQKKVLWLLILIYFFSQSISIVNAINIDSFFSVYKDLAVSLMLFIFAFFTVKKTNISLIITAFITVTVANLLTQLAIYFFNDATITYFRLFFQEKYLQFFTYQSDRGRYFGESLDETIVPFIFLRFNSEKTVGKKLFLSLIICLLFVITLISNWRTKVLIFVFSFFLSIVVYFKKLKKTVVLQIGLLFVILSVSSFFFIKLTSYNVFDRFLLTEQVDVRTIRSRFTYWNQAIDIGWQYPIFGAGLGNYFDNLPPLAKLNNLNSLTSAEKFITIDDPHNIFFSTFANSGLLGMLSLSALLLYFIVRATAM